MTAMRIASPDTPIVQYISLQFGTRQTTGRSSLALAWRRVWLPEGSPQSLSALLNTEVSRDVLRSCRGEQLNDLTRRPARDVPDAADVRTRTYKFERDQAGVS